MLYSIDRNGPNHDELAVTSCLPANEKNNNRGATNQLKKNGSLSHN